jgi:hypothetical protein
MSPKTLFRIIAVDIKLGQGRCAVAGRYLTHLGFHERLIRFHTTREFGGLFDNRK